MKSSVSNLKSGTTTVFAVTNDECLTDNLILCFQRSSGEQHVGLDTLATSRAGQNTLCRPTVFEIPTTKYFFKIL